MEKGILCFLFMISWYLIEEESLLQMSLIFFNEKHGIRRHLSTLRTSQWNGEVERKNSIVIEMARTMTKDATFANVYWKEVVHTIVYILNMVQIRVNHTKKPYEVWNGRPHTMKYFRIFGSKCYIRRDEEDLGKFDTREDEGMLMRYATNKKSNTSTFGVLFL